MSHPDLPSAPLAADHPRISLRDARVEDAEAIAALLEHYVSTSTSLWRRALYDRDERRGWIAAATALRPIVVAEVDGVFAGYASLSDFRRGEGYAGCAEDSVYVVPDRHRGGLGRLLLNELIARAQAAGLHALIGAISGDQAPSIALHAALGFREVGRLPAIGRKWGRRLDLVLMQRDLVTTP